MSLQLKESVQTILALVEEMSGKKIKYVGKDHLDMSSRIRMAGKQSGEHILLYKKKHTEMINYVIANQCGHILRILGVEEDKRYFPVANRKTMMSYMMETEDEIHRLTSVLGETKIRKFIGEWYKGVVFQLTKMPPDIKIDMWIYDNFPELRPIQMQSLQQQLHNAIQGISKEVRKMMPYKVYHVSNIMNYAFFKLLEDHFRLDFVGPYHQTVFIFEGSTLARITEKDYVNSHEGDMDMINMWAERLELTTWFEWKAYDDMPDDYILF